MGPFNLLYDGTHQECAAEWPAASKEKGRKYFSILTAGAFFGGCLYRSFCCFFPFSPIFPSSLPRASITVKLGAQGMTGSSLFKLIRLFFVLARSVNGQTATNCF